MSLPVATSPGRAGFGPQFSLSYDSGAGNGPFGFGWSLSLPSITRKTDKGLPRYCDLEESDVFLLGQWNDTRRGLLAAENLIADLRRLESAHLQRNVRERELTTTVSLARLDPTALTELRMSGRCVIQVPEAVLDLDHPGHYFRRIKALSVTVPCVVGPDGSVPLKLTQTSNRIRVDTTLKQGAANAVDAYAEDPADDPRFRYNVGAIQSIELSRGQDDAGLFNLNLDDERYLPFEGSGVIGTYAAELPQTHRPFDYGTCASGSTRWRWLRGGRACSRPSTSAATGPTSGTA